MSDQSQAAVAPTPRMVDPRQPRVGQFITGSLSLVAFVFKVPALFPVMALILGLATFGGPRLNLYIPIYKGVKSLLKWGPPAELEEAAPPRFANLCGFGFTAGATVAYMLGAEFLAYGLVLIVAALALLASITGLCIGCELYVIGRRIATRGRVARKIVVPREQVGKVAPDA